MRQNFLRKTVIKPKPWGREIWFAWTSQYAGKILEIKKGHRFSLQYHEKKWESQYVVSGKVKFTYGTHSRPSRGEATSLTRPKAELRSALKLRVKILKKGDKVDIPARMIHRAEALTKTVLFEVSSPELDDVTKLEDDYGRTGRGNNEKLDRKLAKK